MKYFSCKFRYSCLDLLPQDDDAIVSDRKRAMAVVDFLLYATKQLSFVLNSFYIKQDYSLFNPHVGENFCQARAVQFLDLAKAGQSHSRTRKRMDQLLALEINLQILKNKLSKENTPYDKYITLQRLLKKNKCYFDVAKTELFLFAGYFLTKFKRDKGISDTYIECLDVANGLDISKKSAKKLVRYYQILVAQYSCDTIFEQMEILYTDPENIKLLRKMQKFDDAKRPVLPCFFSSKILLEYISKKQFPILVIARRLAKNGQDIVAMHYAYNKKNRRYVRSNLAVLENDQTPCFVFSGFVSYLDTIEPAEEFMCRFETAGLRRIFLSGMAAHPQYSGKVLKQYRINPFAADFQAEPKADDWLDDLVHMHCWARDYGCSKNNPTLFSAEHIFFNTPKNCLSILEANSHRYKRVAPAATNIVQFA